ncbi:hypothetical protein ACFSX9_01960 [Flavobacterium ardleyense]|uniref:Membrane or secreted protein n=1 Tax=Flavobacterium ardleyense TaxID=2038737 RepID=A0ABW5Z5R9_9FLAO
MKKYTLILGLILIGTIATLIFIHFSNDHEECDTVTSTTTDSNGNSVKTEAHICKEKYNF